MSKIVMNETQLMSVLTECLAISEDKCVKLSFEHAVEFINEIVASEIDYNSDAKNKFIINYIEQVILRDNLLRI